jgi:hypothetical protein
MKPQEAEKLQISLLRGMGGARRAKIGADLYNMAIEITKCSILEENPEISETEVNEKLISRIWRKRKS